MSAIPCFVGELHGPSFFFENLDGDGKLVSSNQYPIASFGQRGFEREYLGFRIFPAVFANRGESTGFRIGHRSDLSDRLFDDCGVHVSDSVYENEVVGNAEIAS